MQAKFSEPLLLAPEFAPAAAKVYRRSFDAQMPWLAGLHTGAEDAAYFRDHVFQECTVCGVMSCESLIGFAAFRPGWIDQLYVLPEFQNKRIGHALIKAIQSRSEDLQLWTFQRNIRARAFYERHGFEAVEFTDGEGNQEREPDVLYRWQRS